MAKLNEFDAALLVNMSPILLRWFTGNAAKGDAFKLAFTEEKGLYYYEEDDLQKFSIHLSTPWTKPANGQRPRIPNGIQHEIQAEAFFTCPACHSNNNCEIAHIKPVSATFNNHPHNLILLCPNHHSEYDFGHTFHKIDEETVMVFKSYLQSFHRMRWELQRDSMVGYLELINKIGRIKELEEEFPQFKEQGDFKELFEKIKKKLDKIKPSKGDTPRKPVEKIVAAIKAENADATSKNLAYSLLDAKPAIEKEFEKDASLIKCPLCLGKSYTDYYDTCPVCEGDAYIDKDLKVDLSPYEMVQCDLCKGRGQTDFFDVCPPCYGEGSLTKDQYSRIEYDRYILQPCGLCQGRGSTKTFEVCPACAGEGMLTAEQNQNRDFSIYDMLQCPLCAGVGEAHFGEVCPPCGGEGYLTKEQLDVIDLTQYELEECPLCEGKGQTGFSIECPACNGRGKMTRLRINETNFKIYKMVDCTVCKAKGHTSFADPCPACGGDGKITIDLANSGELKKYDIVQCQLCEGCGRTSEFGDCPACGGAGEMTFQQQEATDFAQFEFVRCPRCKGEGCSFCNGEGQITKRRLNGWGY